MTTDEPIIEREDFLRPRLVGRRFENGGVPLEVLKDLSVIEEMMFEVAKSLFLAEHNERQRAPRKFFDDVALKLTGVESGSAVPVIGLEFASNDLPHVYSVAIDYLKKARESFLRLLSGAGSEQLQLGSFPELCLSYFDRLGRSLRDEESIEFSAPGQTTTAKLTKAMRRKLVLLSSQVKEISEEYALRACIPEADQEKMTFTLDPISGPRVTAPIPRQHQDTVLKGFNAYSDGQRVLVQGVARFTRTNRLLCFESIEQVELLDPLDVGARLEELSRLSDGWLEEESAAPPKTGLLWFARRFDMHYPEEIPLPHIYPTAEGNIQAEWTLQGQNFSLEVNLRNKKAMWYGPTVEGDEWEEFEMDLDEDSGWETLVCKLRSLTGAAS